MNETEREARALLYARLVTWLAASACLLSTVAILLFWFTFQITPSEVRAEVLQNREILTDIKETIEAADK